MRRILALAALVLPFAQVGCATIFSGSSEKVTIDTTPPQSQVVVIGGTAGTLILKASKYGDFAQKILKVVAPHVTADGRDSLAKLEIPDLIAQMVAAITSDLGKNAAPGSVEAQLAKLPGPVKDQLLGILGIEESGQAPLSCKLDNGKTYAVVAFREGFRAKIAELDSSFNLLVLLNVLNGFLGVPIDLITGAWLEVGPERLQINLQKR